MTDKTAYVITTDKDRRGVFFGYIDNDADLTATTMRIERCRMCVRWENENHGVVGLAADGPLPSAKVSPAAPAITINGITAYMECSERAIKAWKAEPWG